MTNDQAVPKYLARTTGGDTVVQYKKIHLTVINTDRWTFQQTHNYKAITIIKLQHYSI